MYHFPNLFAGVPHTPLSRVSGQIRMMPVSDMRMAPEVRRGDLVAVVPVDRFHYDSLYLVEFLGVQSIWRCQHIGGLVRLTDNDAHSAPQVLTVTEFAGVVTGIVIVTCRVLDAEALERGLAFWPASSREARA